jgi:hypothetical protein
MCPTWWDLPILKHKVNVVMNLTHAKIEDIRGGSCVFFLHNFFVENLAKVAPKIKKTSLKLHFKKHIFSKFLTFFFLFLEAKIRSPKKKHEWMEGSYNHSLRVRSILCLNRAHKTAYVKDPSHS